MFRLIKLALYWLIGYALYELYLGFTQAGEQREAGGQSQPGALEEGTGPEEPGRRRSDRVISETHDESGFAARHEVGRGALRQ
jgi:hypothetical protein